MVFVAREAARQLRLPRPTRGTRTSRASVDRTHVLAWVGWDSRPGHSSSVHATTRSLSLSASNQESAPASLDLRTGGTVIGQAAWVRIIVGPEQVHAALRRARSRSLNNTGGPPIGANPSEVGDGGLRTRAFRSLVQPFDTAALMVAPETVRREMDWARPRRSDTRSSAHNQTCPVPGQRCGSPTLPSARCARDGR